MNRKYDRLIFYKIDLKISQKWLITELANNYPNDPVRLISDCSSSRTVLMRYSIRFDI